MRTIIINTLGNELRQNQLFYLPFSADQFLWMEKPLDQIGDCVEQLCCYNDALDTRQGCHVVVLVSLAHYELAHYEKLRSAHKQILFAHLNTKLLTPLVQEHKQQLTGVSVVYVLPQPMEGTFGIPTEDIELRVLGIDPQDENVCCAKLSDDNGMNTVDLTEQFANILSDYRKARENSRNFSLSIDVNSGLNSLRRAVGDKLKQLQTCRYLRPGEEAVQTLPVDQIEYRMLTDDWDLFCLDLQLNLSEHLQSNLNSETVWKIKLIPHDAQTLRKRIGQAISRVRYLQQDAPRLTFYELEEPAAGQPPKDISGEIWTQLLANTQLPGIEEAKLHAELDQAQKDAGLEDNHLTTKLRKAWLLVGLEKKRFDSYCEIMDQQYAPDVARKQQKDILDICARVFGEWRRKVLTRKETFPTQAKAIQLPVFDVSKYEKEVDEAQKKWGAATVKQLDDYEDVRQQAEQIKADFRKEFRLWPDGCLNATTKFCIYSIVLAVLFLIQMMIPYVAITMGQPGASMSRFVHFGLSLLSFLGLYGVGLLFWLHGMCKRLHKHTTKMYMLLQDSHRRRRESVERAVEIYGSVLPQCTFSYEQLQRLREIHEENLQRKERYNTHMSLLSKAEELLYELRTLLRMQGAEDGEMPRLAGGINYEKAPSHPENVPYYVFMSEKWGR